MSILSRFAKNKAPKAALEDVQSECKHLELAPRWNSVEDMGINDRATSFACTTCGETFTPEEARENSLV